jgi:hypothetical protein
MGSASTWYTGKRKTIRLLGMGTAFINMLADKGQALMPIQAKAKAFCFFTLSFFILQTTITLSATVFPLC